MSNTGRLYNKNFNVIETENSFNDLYNVYTLNNNKDVVNELQGSILISLTPNANEILLCSDKLYNLTPRFTDPIVSEINRNNIINVSLKYDKNFTITKDGKLTLNSNIINQLNDLTSEIKHLQNQIDSLETKIKELKGKDDESIDDDNLNTEE